MSNYGTIEILDDWNAAIAACGCCLMPACPVPTQECQTLTGDALSYGFIDAGDTIWKRYKKQETVLLLVEDTAVETKNVHTLANETTAQEYPQLFQGGVGDGTDGCTWWSATTIDTCSSEGTKTVNYTLTLNGDPQTQYKTDRTDVSGQETVAHLAWEAAETQWLIDYPSGPTRVEAKATYEAWLECEALTPGACGLEPTIGPDDYGDNVEEPTELYPDCSYKDTIVFTDFTEDPDLIETTITYGDSLTTSYSDEGSQVATTTTTLTDGLTYEEWVDTVRDTLIAGITFPQDDCLDAPLCYSSMSVTAEPVSPNLNNDVTMSVQKTRYRWEIPVVGTINDPAATLPTPPDPPEPLPEGQTEAEWEAEWEAAWWADHQLDQRWLGSYFKITWDVLTEPIGWDDTINDPDYEPPVPNDPPEPIPQVPRPGRPARSYVQDLTWEWTGPGTQVPNPILNEALEVTNQAAIDAALATWQSGWYMLEIPGEPGTRRVINIRFECYGPTPYGQKPQTTGEGVDLDEDSPLQLRFTSDHHSIKLPTITI